MRKNRRLRGRTKATRKNERLRGRTKGYEE